MVYCVKRFTVQYSVVIPIFAKDMRFSRLLDVYGVLLSDRKRDILDYYYNEDYSLAEIAELGGLSRQGVWDIIRRAEESLRNIEEKTGLIARFASQREAAAKAEATLAELLPLTEGRAQELTESLNDTIRELRHGI